MNAKDRLVATIEAELDNIHSLIADKSNEGVTSIRPSIHKGFGEAFKGHFIGLGYAVETTFEFNECYLRITWSPDTSTHSLVHQTVKTYRTYEERVMQNAPMVEPEVVVQEAGDVAEDFCANFLDNANHGYRNL